MFCCNPHRAAQLKWDVENCRLCHLTLKYLPHQPRLESLELESEPMVDTIPRRLAHQLHQSPHPFIIPPVLPSQKMSALCATGDHICCLICPQRRHREFQRRQDFIRHRLARNLLKNNTRGFIIDQDRRYRMKVQERQVHRLWYTRPIQRYCLEQHIKLLPRRR